jgi:hypothetical protein
MMVAIRTALQIGCFSDFSLAPLGYSFSTEILDGATDEIAAGYVVNSTDAITHIGVRVGGAVQSPPIYQVSLQGMSSTGFPDGTILGGGSPASATFNPAAWAINTFHWVALDNPYTPTVGQIVMPVVEYSSGTIGGSNRIFLVRGWTNIVDSSRFRGLFTTGNWSSGNSATGRPGLAIRTANARFGIVAINNTPTAVDLGTNGHRDAIKFTLPDFFSTLTCHGLRVGINTPSSGTFKLGIWNASGTELAAETITVGTLATTNDSIITCGFSAPVTINPDTTYYAGIERISTACGLVHAELSEANDQLAYPLGTAACRATWNGSAWTDNTTFRPLSLELLISDITGGGGGASFPLIGPGGLVY